MSEKYEEVDNPIVDACDLEDYEEVDNPIVDACDLEDYEEVDNPIVDACDLEDYEEATEDWAEAVRWVEKAVKLQAEKLASGKTPGAMADAETLKAAWQRILRG